MPQSQSYFLRGSHKVNIPPGYRELNLGERIEPGDKICPRDSTRFKAFSNSSRCLGCEYKNPSTPLYPEAVVIRKIIPPVPKEAINIICAVPLNMRPEIVSYIEKHPVLTGYDRSAIQYTNGKFLYILTDFEGVRTDFEGVPARNLIGYAYSHEDSAFRKCKKITVEDLLHIVCPNLKDKPEYRKPIWVSLSVNLRVEKC